jgi:metal-dependent amidase/aminoacylase/carboxypeptidase family protein
MLIPATTGAEDFSFFAQKVQDFIFSLVQRPKARSKTVGDHHTILMDDGV